MTQREFLDIVFALVPKEANTIMDAFDEYVESAQLGTNLAEVGMDCISRQAVMLRVREFIGNPSYTEKMLVDELNGLPPAQPNNDLQNLAEEIAAFKRSFKSANSDYLTGYLSALSLVEGMIAERREVSE